ncbi:PAS domain S-box protein [Candidatus Poribacteria bacterium]|nr:PAS domain S-box protein [Candidatus Poribacteria bacterium]
MQKEHELLSNFYISVINSIPIGTMTINSELVIASMNPAMERIFGVRAEDFLGLHVQNLFCVFFKRQYAQELIDKLQDVLITKDSLSVEVRLTPLEINPREASVVRRGISNEGNPETSYINLIASPLFSSQDIVMGLLLMFEDITELKQVEEAQAKAMVAIAAEKEKTAAIEAMEDGMVLVNMDGKVNAVNPAFEKMVGYEKKELVGKDAAVLVQKLIKSENLEKIRASLRAVLKGKVFPCTPYILIAKDGREMPVISNVSFIKDVDGKPTTIVTTIKDITELRRAEEQINASLQEKEVLLREIHHRVKNNLQIISSLLGLQSNYVQDKQTLEALNESRSRIRTMSLVHELLYQSENLSRIDFNEYIRNLTGYLFQSVDNLGVITLNINVDDDVSLNINTAIPCGLIINELVSNSLKHAFPRDREGKICIAFTGVPTEDNNVAFTLIVSDNGVGFSQNLDFRNPESLGLQLVTALVNQLKGTIELDRSHGTAFKITFRAKKVR